MIFNIAKLVNNDRLLEEKQALELVEELNKLNWNRYRKAEFSLTGADLISLNFLIPFIKFTLKLDETYKSLDIKINCKNNLHKELIAEAVKVVRGEMRHE